MATSLTAGAISMLSTGQWQTVDLKPVLQVLDARIIGGGENRRGRYLLMLSDGFFSQQAVLATQRVELVTSQQLQKGSIVQLTAFVCSTIEKLSYYSPRSQCDY